MDRTAILNTYVTDMKAVETHIHSAVERQLESEDTRKYPDAVQALTALKTILEQHTEALGAHIDQAEGGGLKESVKEALGSALGVAAGLYDQIRTDKVSRMIRDTYTATSLAAISYHMLYTTALGLKSEIVAALALSNLKDLTPVLVNLSKVVCTVVADELDDEDKVYTASVGVQAVRDTQEAWSSDAVQM
ncbi:MAG TPA: hypothetical protein VGB53_10615 [Rubricoccaceae bacterium]|jgi:hypothetical protein